MTHPPTPPASQQEYIITEDMIRIWRNRCVALPAHTDTDECKACQYRGKGKRERCCDFDETDMEKIFRSLPLFPTPASTPDLPVACKRCIHNKGGLQAHDAAISKQAADAAAIAALKELDEFVDINELTVPDEEDESSDDMVMSGELRAKIDEIRRRHAPQQEPERHDTIKLMKRVPFDLTPKEVKDMEDGKNIVRKTSQQEELHKADKDSKNFNKGQFVGDYKPPQQEEK